MIKRKAIVAQDGTVENVILIEDGAEWTPPENTILVEDDGTARMGGVYADKKFGPAPAPRTRTPEDWTLEEKFEALRADVELMKAARLR